MNHMKNIQSHIEITRQQIIGQLHDEISQFQRELGKMHIDSAEQSDAWGYRVYHTIIARKRKLITSLS